MFDATIFYDEALSKNIVDTNKWDWENIFVEGLKIVPATIGAITGNTPTSGVGKTSAGSSSTSGGTVSGTVTLESILSDLGFSPKISDVAISIPKWVYLVMIAAGVMLFVPFFKSLRR